MSSRMVIATAVTAILLSPLAAQIRGAGGATVGGRSGFVGHGNGFGPGHAAHGRGGRGSLLLPYPYYDSGFGYDYQEPAPARVEVVPAAAPAPPAPPAVPLEPLLIEWQGDHFERMRLSQKSGSGAADAPDYSEQSRLRPANAPVASALPRARKVAVETPRRELPPAVLVFRDGRHEEVSSYTIMSGTIYSKADYWSSGSWTKKIQIADLDVPATLKLNQDRGLNFLLPGGPNEVVTRP